ncbi:MAG: hypothetical protein ACREO4_06185 [Lysobacter sp.]
MAAAIENVRGAAAHQPAYAAELGEPASIEVPTHPLDSPEALRIHARLLDWWYTGMDAQFDNRLEQQQDYDFYDHIQWSIEDQQVLAARHQAPLTYNKIKMALDWIIGTERRTRIDGAVHPRTEDDVDLAEVKGELLKYLSDTNRVPWERSKAFKDAAISGVGWTEETIRTDRAEEPVMVKHVPWRHMWWDPYSRADDLSDARFVIRQKYVDLEYAEAMVPGRVELVRRAARDHLYTDDYGEEELDLPQVFRKYDSRGHELSGKRIGGRVSVDSRMRLRVRMLECWFRKPVAVKKLWGPGFAGVEYDPQNEEHQDAKASIDNNGNIFSLTDAISEQIWCAIFTEEGLLQLSKSPFKHGQLPFTPYWCYRRNRDGMPYGVVRGIRDSQEDLNKRMSKLLWALSCNQLFYEDSAIDEDNLEEIKREIAKPNGVLKFADGALSGGRVKVERNMDVADAQIQLLELDAAHIHDGSGVNRELLGRETNATSGRAILAKQQEGAVTTAELFDNYRLGIQCSCEKQLSLVEQYMTQQRQFRIVGERRGVDWRLINEVRLDSLTGQWEVQNDITKSHADFVVDQQDFRESMRQAYAEQFFEMLGKLPPDYAIQLLDMAFEMTDVPGKDEIVKRIRQINGQSGDDGEETPEMVAKREAEQADRDLTMRERLAKVGLDQAKADELIAKTKGTGINTKAASLKLAELLDVLLPLAPAADRLLSTTQPPEEATDAVA